MYKLFKITFMVFLLLSPLSADTGSKQIPGWMSNFKEYTNGKECAIGYAKANSLDKAKEALNTGLFEIGYAKKIDISSSNTITIDDHELDTQTMLTKQLGYKVDKGGYSLENWTASNGDYFSFVCTNTELKGNKKVASMIKYYKTIMAKDYTIVSEFVGSIIMGEHRGYKRFFSESSNSYTYENNSSNSLVINTTIPNDTCMQDNTLAPTWTCSNEEVEDSEYALQKVNIINGNILDAYIEAMTATRMKLSEKISNSSLNKGSKQTNTNTIKTISKVSVNKIMTANTLYNAELLKMWHNKKNDTLFVLMSADERLTQ